MSKTLAPLGGPSKTLIFHIGHHKTGSTSIQTAFASGSVALGAGDVFYPAKLSHNWLEPHFRNYSNPDRPEDRHKAIAVFQNLVEKFRQSHAEFCLISAEALENVPPAVFHEVVERFFTEAFREIKVVAYVRPHAGRITSSFAERVKTGAPGATASSLTGFFEAVEKRKEFFYEPSLSGWRSHFGDNFIVRPMVPSLLYKESVVEDFIKHAFDTNDFRVSLDERANKSLSLEDLMRIKVLQSTLLAQKGRRPRWVIGWEFARILESMPAPKERTKLSLHKSLAQNIRSSYQADACAIDNSFFDGRPILQRELDRAVETAIDEPQSTEPQDHFSASELRSLELFSQIIAVMASSKDTKWTNFLRKNRINKVEKLGRDNASQNSGYES